MRLQFRFALLLLFLAQFVLAQSAPPPKAPDKAPESGTAGQESSSRDSHPDIAPPKDDAKEHPDSKTAVKDLTPPDSTDVSSDVQEFHPWNPMKAMKDVEVGDYYFKRKNYKAALDRYKEALYYKNNDAVATYRLAVCQEKLGEKVEARQNFEQYLKILPDGPLAKEAQASVTRLAKAE